MLPGGIPGVGDGILKIPSLNVRGCQYTQKPFTITQKYLKTHPFAPHHVIRPTGGGRRASTPGIGDDGSLNPGVSEDGSLNPGDVEAPHSKLRDGVFAVLAPDDEPATPVARLQRKGGSNTLTHTHTHTHTHNFQNESLCNV